MTIATEIDLVHEAVAAYMPETAGGEHADLIIQCIAESMPQYSDEQAEVAVFNLPTVVAGDAGFNGWVTAIVESWLADEYWEVQFRAIRASLVDATRFYDDAVVASVNLVSPVLMRALLDSLYTHRTQGKLTGATPEQRFLSFRSWLASRPGKREFLKKYRASLGFAHERVNGLIGHLVEVVARWQQDSAEVMRQLPGLAGDVRISRLHTGSGDTHGGGRSVTIVELGSGAKVVYKPRGLAADAGFAALVGHLNSVPELTGVDDAYAPMRAVRVVDRGSWGWAEHVEVGAQPADLGRYRRQLGLLTGLLHVLGATDIHYENVITDSSGRPVLVDCETLLSPQPLRSPAYDDGAASKTAREIVSESVLGIGTLPMRVSVPGRDGSVDIGVAGRIDPGGTQLFGSLVVHNAGRDDMHVRLERLPLSAKNANAGVSAYDLADVLAFRDAVRGGVVDVLSWARRNTTRVFSLIEDALGAAPMRFVHHPTIFYTQLLRMQTHPDILRDQLARHTVLSRVLLREDGEVKSIAKHEVTQMLGGDVPLFTFRPGERHLRGPDGSLLEENYFTQTPLEQVRGRIEQLTTAEIERQADLVGLGFLPTLPDGGETTGLRWGARATSPHVTDAQPTSVQRTADGGAQRILKRWVGGTDTRHPATFYGPLVTTSDASQWEPGVLGYDLYGGTVGIAFGLTVSGATQRVRGAREQVDAILGPITDQLVSGRLTDHVLSPGGMTGVGGTVWALGAIAAHEKRPLDRPELIRALAAHTNESSATEFVTGLAGAVCAAMSLLRQHGGQHAESRLALRRMAEPLRKAALHISEYGSFPDQQISAFTGMAHGVAGVLAALAVSSDALADRQLGDAAAELAEVLLESRRRHGKWARQLDGSDQSHAWCHGAPGILLALSVAASCGAPVPAEALDELTEQSQQSALGNNPSLCHGDLGTLDVLLESARLRGDAHLAQQSANLLAEAATHFLSTPPDAAQDRYHQTDSLMVGTAGALYALARATNSSVPCVLALH